MAAHQRRAAPDARAGTRRSRARQAAEAQARSRERGLSAGLRGRGYVRDGSPLNSAPKNSVPKIAPTMPKVTTPTPPQALCFWGDPAREVSRSGESGREAVQ